MKHLGQNLSPKKPTAIPQLSYMFRQLTAEIFDIHSYGENRPVKLITYLHHLSGSLQCFRTLLALSLLPSFLFKLHSF